MHLFSKENIYKDDVYVNLSHRGCPPLLVTYWMVNHRCREQVGSDLGSGLPSLASWWTHGDQGGIWVMVKGFSRGRSVVLKSWSVLVLSSSNNQMPAKVLWTSPNEAHSAHWRDEQPGPTTLLSTAIWLPFFFHFQSIRGNEWQLFMFPASSSKKRGWKYHTPGSWTTCFGAGWMPTWEVYPTSQAVPGALHSHHWDQSKSMCWFLWSHCMYWKLLFWASDPSSWCRFVVLHNRL